MSCLKSEFINSICYNITYKYPSLTNRELNRAIGNMQKKIQSITIETCCLCIRNTIFCYEKNVKKLLKNEDILNN